MSKKYEYVLGCLQNLACPEKRFVKKDTTTPYEELEICDLLICYSEEERAEIFGLLKERDKLAYTKVTGLWAKYLMDATLQQDLKKHIAIKNALTDEMELS